MGAFFEGELLSQFYGRFVATGVGSVPTGAVHVLNTVVQQTYMDASQQPNQLYVDDSTINGTKTIDLNSSTNTRKDQFGNPLTMHTVYDWWLFNLSTTPDETISVSGTFVTPAWGVDNDQVIVVNPGGVLLARASPGFAIVGADTFALDADLAHTIAYKLIVLGETSSL